MKTSWLSAAAGGALCLWALVSGCGSRGQRLPPGALSGYNFLLVTIDTLRTDRLGCYGSRAGLTPHLDRLAAGGIRFASAYAHAPLTLPSHTSIFTGQFPFRHGVHDNGSFRVPTGQETLATRLRRQGYRTAAFVGSFVLDARFGLNQGFELYDDYYGEKRPFQIFDVVERPAEAVLARVPDFLRKGSPGDRWFVWVHLWDPHLPYAPPEHYSGDRRGDAYGAEVAYADGALGRFLEDARRAGRLDRTLVVVTGDHGESLGDHGERSHGTFAYDSTLRVPWILWAGNALAPAVFTGTVRHVDLLPTVLDLLAVPAVEPLDGQSLRPYLAGEKSYQPPPSYFEALNTHLTRDWAPLRGVVHRGFKLIALPIPELYDLGRDPGERENLHEHKRATAAELRETLASLAKEEEALTGQAPDRETLERLRALGYVSSPLPERRTSYSEADDPKRLIELSNLYDEAAERTRLGDQEGALGILTALVARQPRSSQASQALAVALYQSGRVDDAVKALEAARDRGVDDVSLLGLLGAYLLEAGEPRRAAEVLEDVVRRDPEYAEGHNYLGVALSRLGRFVEAERAYRRVLELDPSSASARNNLGSLALARGATEQAEAWFREALSFDPDLASVHNGLGVVLARTGRMQEALAAWRRAVELNPGLYDALYNLAVGLFERSPSQARPLLERFVREAPVSRYAADLQRCRSLLAATEPR